MQLLNIFSVTFEGATFAQNLPSYFVGIVALYSFDMLQAEVTP